MTTTHMLEEYAKRAILINNNNDETHLIFHTNHENGNNENDNDRFTGIFLEKEILGTLYGWCYKGYQYSYSEGLPNRNQLEDSNYKAVKSFSIAKYNRRCQDGEDPDNEIKIRIHVDQRSTYGNAFNNHIILPQYVLSDREQIEQNELHNNQSHRNVNGMYYYMISHYANEGDIFEQKNKLGHEDCKTIFKQIVEGVQYLHSLDIFHKDLKPENFVMSKNHDRRDAYIIDFGQARVIENGEKMIRTNGQGYGTTDYSGPEFLSDSTGMFDWKKADVWSLGVSLYTMMMGKRPVWRTPETSDPYFQYISVNKRLAQFLKANADQWNEFPSDDAINLLQNMLLEKPEERISVDEILSHPFLE